MAKNTSEPTGFDEFSSFVAGRARSSDRVFAEARHDQKSNVNGWKKAIAAAPAMDGKALAEALISCEGMVEPFGRKGQARRNALAKAVMALRADPEAWGRLRRGERWGSHSGERHVADADWTPHTVGLAQYLWAAHPEALALAATAWREKCEATDQFNRNPFLYQNGWDGRTESIGMVIAESRRVFHHGMRDPQRPPDDPPGLPPTPTEQAALRTIVTETARACVSHLWRYEERQVERRAAGEKVWKRGSAQWDMRWLTHMQDWTTRGVDELGKPRDAAVAAIEAIMAESLALSPEAGAESARRLLLSLADSSEGEHLGLKAISLLEAHPEGSKQPLPFGPHDWLSPRLVARLPVSDEKLGAWLADIGETWSAPGSWDIYGKKMTIGAPAWSYEHQAGKEAPHGAQDWTMLEWTLLLGRPAAARQACMLGSKLHPEFEEAILAMKTTNPLQGVAYPMDALLALAEACRMAEASRAPEAPGPEPKAMRL